jgi:polysaccharide export outer membrane protein
MNLLLSLLLLVSAAPPSQAPGQPPPPPVQQPQTLPAPQTATAGQGAYTIGPQDLLMITVFDEPDLTNKYRVDPDGMVTFPLIGRVIASGLTLTEFQERLRQQLAAGYLRNPQVRVDIDQYKSQSVFVGGEVRLPGKITMSGTMTLPEALAAAGSPLPSASNEVIITHLRRPAAPGAPAEPDTKDADGLHVNLKDLQLGKVGQDIVLQDGDTVFVPKAQQFYITGQVRNPGQYVLDPGMTVLQAISIAGGLNERGSDRGIKIERIVDGKRVEVDAKLTDIVQANDTIRIRPRFF